MKKFALLISIIVSINIISIGCSTIKCGCKYKNQPKETLNWAGTYKGAYPCASSSKISISLTIYKSGRFELVEKYVPDGDTFITEGNFKWDETGSIIILSLNQTDKRYYEVNKDFLAIPKKTLEFPELYEQYKLEKK